MPIVTRIVLGVFLAGSLIQDLRSKKISYIWLLANLPVAVGISLYGDTDFVSLLLSLIPGTLLLLISLLSRDRVGKGDSLIILVMGIYLGLSTCFLVLILGLLLSAMFGVGLMLVKKISVKHAIIFTPFLCVAYLIFCLLEYLEGVL